MYSEFLQSNFDLLNRRGGRVVECGGLENRYRGNFIEGSNPSFSARILKITILIIDFKNDKTYFNSSTNFI